MSDPTPPASTTESAVEHAVSNKVRQVISNIRNLPTPPIVFHQIQRAINDPKASAGQVAAVLAEDPAMSVKVLKLTNSAFYGLAREIESVKQAVVVIGMEAIKNLVLSASVIDMFKGKDYDPEFQDQFWRHSLATAFASRMLAHKLRQQGMVDPDTAFSAGLLHDIGKIVMACFLKDEFSAIALAREENPDLDDSLLEHKVLGYTHSEIGGLLAEQWKLPRKLSEAIIYHHRPDENTDSDCLPYIVHIGDHVAKLTFSDQSQLARLQRLDNEVLDHMGTASENIEGYSDTLREEYVKAETFMQMAGLGG
jgi:putative nucleotidyltransferase with HDIG domain